MKISLPSLRIRKPDFKIDLHEMTIMPFIIIMALVINISMSLSDLEMQLLSYADFAVVMGSLIPILLLYLFKGRMSQYGFLHFLYMAFLTGVTVLNEADIKNVVYESLKVWMLLIIIYYYRDRMKMLLVCFCLAFSFCIYANFLHVLIHPEKWLVDAEKEAHEYLLGNNYNQMGIRMIAALASSLLCVRFSKWWVFNIIVLGITSVTTLILVGCKTSLACIVLIHVFFLIPSLRVKKITLISTFIVIVLFQVFVVFNGKGLENNALAVYIVVDILNKDITFTNRTEMWDSGLRVILKSPLWGWGLVDLDWMRHNMSSKASGPHNLILSILINGGLLLLSIYITICYQAVRKMFRNETHVSLGLLFIIVIAMLNGLMEMYPIIFMFYLLAMAFYYPYLTEATNSANPLHS